MKYIFRTIMTAAVMAAGMTAIAQTEGAVAVEEVSKPAPQVKVRKAQRGIIVVDSAGIVRAMSPFAGSQANARKYAAAVNRYSRETGDSVKVYSMVVPLAIAYYCLFAHRPPLGSARSLLRSRRACRSGGSGLFAA